ncbi:hypothetical protein R1flu_015463 [Riccia fluitans]|uniref:Bulb-type lectin domain-containing protein n=1 Tax=Riccia fluitans TaxID=41844 RepID=A0ABD1YM51_9MARC
MMVIRKLVAPMLFLLLRLVQTLLISTLVTAQAPAPSLEASPGVPSTSPPATFPPAESPIPVVETFPTNTTFALLADNGTHPIRQTAVALTSPAGIYALALVMDGFGKEGATRDFCWTEVYRIHNQQDVTFRVNCKPFRVEHCSLSLTLDGDLRLTLESAGGKLVSWRTSTENHDVTEAKLDDAGVLTLVKADGTVVWSSDDHNQGCPQPFRPPDIDESSGSLRFSACKYLVVLFSTLLGLTVPNCLW